jgi:diguanylate cyclase (GGDEF)-like protein/PAS domain S-box-containing protein
MIKPGQGKIAVRYVMERKRSMNFKHRMPLIAVTFTSVLCIAISIFSLKSGWFIVFQNFFYIPIIIACYYYKKQGFAISVALSCIYFFLIIAFTSDPMIIRDAAIRVILFILIAAVITALSIARAQAEAALKKEREKFRTVADFTYDWEYWTDPQQNMLYVSPSCERISGYRPADFMTESGLIHSVVHTDDSDIFKRHADHYHESHIDSVGEVEFRIVTRNGEERWIAHLCQPVYSSDGQFLGRRASNRDITKRKQAEEALRTQNKTFSQVLNGLDALVYVVDMKTYEIVFINTYGQNIWGDIKGKICWQTIQAGRDGPCEFCTNSRLVGPDGNPTEGVVWEFQNTVNKRWYDCRDRAIYWPDGRIVRMEIATDITSRKQSEEKIQQMAYHDSLTGLPNRKLFSDRLHIALAQAQRNKKGVGIAMLDLDNFKSVNDTLGHDLGDLLLKAAAGRLSAALRKGDAVARFGGDEFLLILHDLEVIEDAIQVAQKIVDLFSKPFLIDIHQLVVTTSIGIAVYPNDGIDEGILLKNADIAMYQAKQAGRDRYQLYKEA